MALRAAILGRLRIPVQAHNLDLDRTFSLQQWSLCSWIRSMSSHGDDHLDKEEVKERVLSVVKSFPKLDPSKVTPDVHFQKDLGLDSLDNVEIVMALEEEFKLEIPDKEADKIDSCSLAIEYISNHPMAG
ncbi:acyl carrier protein 1, mitochondrial-like [Aristolochia californica]|uniref:acyl carrier protein 1, mitochondrial-like n=1 Tax=Aristolochia californica TaxID=171875 RepID=UPI0035D814F5